MEIFDVNEINDFKNLSSLDKLKLGYSKAITHKVSIRAIAIELGYTSNYFASLKNRTTSDPDLNDLYSSYDDMLESSELKSLTQRAKDFNVSKSAFDKMSNYNKLLVILKNANLGKVELSEVALKYIDDPINATDDDIISFIKNLKNSLIKEFQDSKISLHQLKLINKLMKPYDIESENIISEIGEALAEKINNKTTKQKVEEDRLIRKLKNENSELKNKYDHIHKEYESINRKLSIYESMENITDKVIPIEIEKNSPKGEATAIALYSDWHLEEQVLPEDVNDLNEFNLKIAETRASNCFSNTLKLIEKERQAVEINRLVIWLGGDFISGYIHDELIENNLLKPMPALIFAKDLLYSGIKYLNDHGKFNEILVVCNHGNHGRTTRRMHHSKGHENSYEWLLYQQLQDRFHENDRIKFSIAKSDIHYVKLYNKNIRFMHGHNVRYSGGIGGIGIPLNKAIHKYDSTIKADYTILGHFHQLVHPTSRCTVNGSLIGYNGFAASHGFQYEPPVQGFKLLDKEKGFTVSAPIITETKN